VETDSRKPNVPRAVNDHLYNAMWGVAAEEGPFLCECGDSFCPVVVVMKPAEYVRLRGREEFVYAPGHEGGIP
jgi:hypothetical protein